MSTTNEYLQTLIHNLRKESYAKKAPLWLRIAEDLERPSRNRRAVNLSRINLYSKADEIVIVPGKVLGSGMLDHKVTVAAWQFSNGARTQIANAKGRCLSIEELMSQNPKPQNVKIIG